MHTSSYVFYSTAVAGESRKRKILIRTLLNVPASDLTSFKRCYKVIHLSSVRITIRIEDGMIEIIPQILKSSDHLFLGNKLLSYFNRCAEYYYYYCNYLYSNLITVHMIG